LGNEIHLADLINELADLPSLWIEVLIVLDLEIWLFEPELLLEIVLPAELVPKRWLKSTKN
jgi:hypothetical protein